MGAALLAGGLGACAQHDGRLIVLVESDIPDLRHVEVTTVRLAGGGRDTHGFRIGNGLGDTAVPFSFAVAPNGHPSDGVEIRVEGYDRDPIGAGPIVTRTVRTGFVAGSTRLVRIALDQDCRGELCLIGSTTCEAGSCRPIPELMPDDLPIVTHPGAEFEDAGMDTGSRDTGGIDAMTDVRVVDTSGLDAPDVGMDVVDAPSTDADLDGCVAVPEACNGLDENCNGTADDGATCPVGTCFAGHCSTCVPGAACSAPIGGECSAGEICVCPSGQSDCGGTCQTLGGVCPATGDAACGAGSGTVICSGGVATCSSSLQTSGRCPCTAPSGLCTCSTAGLCVEAYVEVCLDACFGSCTRLPQDDAMRRLDYPSLAALDNSISSIRLVNVAGVTLFENNTFSGRTVTLTGDCPDLHARGTLCGSPVVCGTYTGGGGHIGDAASSMSIRP